MRGADLALAVDHERGRQSEDAAPTVGDGVVAEHDRVVHLGLVREGSYILDIVVHGYTYDFQTRRRVAVVELLQPRNHDLARLAPRGPKIHDYDFALEIFQVDGAAFQILQHQPGRSQGQS